MIEIYPSCESREISGDLLSRLEKGWQTVFKLLQEIGAGEIASLDGMEITLLDDGDMVKVHDEFLNDASTTDVITFDHGELLIGVETAQRQAKEFHSHPDREIALYGIHGMLHLSGFDDRLSADAKEMARRQEELLKACFSDWD